MSNAISQYAADNNYYPLSYSSEGDWIWQTFLMDGTTLNSNHGVLPNSNTGNSPGVRTVYQCPANPSRYGNRWSGTNYGYNVCLGLYQPGNNNTPLIDGDYGKLYVRPAQLEQPSRTVLVNDATMRNPAKFSVEPKMEANYTSSYVSWENLIAFDWHGTKANFVMADGHVEGLSKDEVSNRIQDKTLLWARDNNRRVAW